jgi:TATA-box binding protein (TBP) (component of TFIID and TFIIIB)
LGNVLGEEIQQEHFEIRNLLYKGEFGIELDLEELHSDLPKKTEQHPALYFRSDINGGLTDLISNGQVHGHRNYER